MSVYVVNSSGTPNPNYIDQNVPENMRYNPEKGLDIDGEIVGQMQYGDLYDYDLLSRPNVGVSGSGIIIPQGVDSGFPSLDDYTINPDGSKTRVGMEDVRYKTDFLSDDQSQSLNMMTDQVNNGRLGDVKVVADISVPENTDIVIKKDNSDSSIKGILENNSINDIFFSEMNTNTIQDTIRYHVHQNTDQVISRQSENELFIIMRSIMLQFANFRTDVDDIVNEVKRLNSKVIEYAVSNVTSNVKQHKGYVDDLSKLPVPMDMPVYHNKRSFTYDISNLL